MKIKFSTLLLFILISSHYLFSQNLSEGYQEFKLGSTREEVENLLKKSNDFQGNKPDIITMRLQPDQQIITVKGKG